MYSENSKEILNRLLDQVPNDLNKSKGSFFYDSLSPLAEELAQSKIQLDEVLDRVFAVSAAENGYSDDLENRCAESGIYRKDGTHAIGQVTFIGTDNVNIPINTLVQTDGGLQYITLTDTTIINGSATTDIKATSIGIAYNLPSNAIKELPVQITGITAVTNINPIIGGTEKENDNELLNRFLLQKRTLATSGNESHYKLWATEVNGVGDAVVMSTWAGAGTVKVIVLGSDKHTPSQEVLDNVILNIQTKRPIGAVVTVEGAVEVPINITVTLQLASGIDINDTKNQIQTGIKTYLDSLAFKDPLVRYTRIANILLDVASIIDYSNLIVNGGTENIEIPQGSVAVLGTVNINAI